MDREASAPQRRGQALWLRCFMLRLLRHGAGEGRGMGEGSSGGGVAVGWSLGEGSSGERGLRGEGKVGDCD